MQLPLGFRFSGIQSGIKASGKPDMALIANAQSGPTAGVYTQNKIVAAPVLWCRERTPGPIRAVVINSGNANACTGERGRQDAARMAELVANELKCTAEEVLVMSTGVIGHHLPMEKIERGIPQLVGTLADDEEGFLRSATAILTTDQGKKTADRSFASSQGTSYTICGMAKGAGMIGPNMATMLGIVVTDFPLDPALAQQLLQRVADQSFNRISVEGHTSTNDSLVLMAAEATQADASPSVGADDLQRFEEELTALCIELAKKIPADGEGASHLIEITVTGADCDASAVMIAKTVSQSALVKTAITGGDPNWGRIVSAAGYADCPLDPAKTALTIQGIEVYRDGAPCKFDAKQASQAIRDRFEVQINLQVGEGAGKARFWTSDLTQAYVHFNSEYTT